MHWQQHQHQQQSLVVEEGVGGIGLTPTITDPQLLKAGTGIETTCVGRIEQRRLHVRQLLLLLHLQQLLLRQLLLLLHLQQ